MSDYAKGLQNVGTFVSRWKNRLAKRYNRIYDDRDQALADALKLVEERSDDYYAALHTIVDDLTLISVGTGALTGLAMTGTNLVGDSDTASGASASSTGTLTLTAVVPGSQTITATITIGSGATQIDAADAAAGTFTINSSSGGATAADLATVINGHEEVKYMVQASGDGSDVDAAETVSVTNTSGVADPGTLPAMTLGAQSFNGATVGFGFTAWTDTAITFDMDPTALTVGTTYFLRLWVDDVLVIQVPVTIIT